MSLALLRWLWFAQLREQPGRLLAAAATIAIGVALGLAIHLVNRSALDEFDAALAVVNGEAQARIEPRSESLDEGIWPRIADAQGVAEASPVIDLTVALSGAGSLQRLRLIGIDPMRAARVTPDLVPNAQGSGAGIELFADDAIFLSPHALERAGLQVGDTLRIGTGGEEIALRIAGEVPRVAADMALGVMDIGTLQWRLGWLGRLSRIDLRLSPGVSPTSLAVSGALALPDEALLVSPDAARQRMSNLSRAYRVNLSVLALVALFTGVFIVHAAMSLAVAREQAQLALLGVLGARPRLRLVQMLGLGLLPGAAGSLAGVAGGVAAARLLLDLTGGDLGGGYFSGATLSLSLPLPALVGFGLAGLAAAALGSAAAAWRAARLSPARALRAGRSGALDEGERAGMPIGLVATCVVIGAALLAAPAVDGLPIPAYATIAIWLVAGIGLLPHLLGRLAPLLRSDRVAGIGPLAWLAAQRVSQSPGSVSAALAGIVAAIALASAMAIMVTSFRVSVSQWLDNVLPADLYGRLETVVSGAGVGLDAATRDRIARLPGVERVEFLHVSRITLDPARPPVTLLARPIDAAAPQARLPLTGLSVPVPDGEVPIWISEAVVDLLGWRPGMRIELPVPGAGWRAFVVAGVWRDYARQHGAIAIDLAAWESVAREAPVTEFGLWLDRAAGQSDLIAHLETIAGPGRSVSVRSAAALRELSLRIFDRSFAATWALEAVAVIVALFGIASAWSAEAIARRREFGMLRHLGLTPVAIARQFALEAGILVGAAVCWGVALGALIAMVLVHRVNPQSFHWTMDMAWPLGPMLAAGIAMIALAAIVAALAGRHAGSASPIRAVREDW